MKILIADDHSVVRQGMSLILKEAFDGIEVFHTDSFESAIVILKNNQINLLLLDINLPGGNSIDMINDVKQVQNTTKILMFSAFDEDQYALKYMKAGAKGYVNKLSSEDKIIEAVKIVLEGGDYISSKLKAKISENGINKVSNNPLSILSNREMEIAGLLTKGEGNLEIANKLNIGMSTVSTYKSRIFEKLGINNVVSLVEKFKRYG
ncbi:Oxygen regulatory protein NreC [compost metagenome]